MGPDPTGGAAMAAVHAAVAAHPFANSVLSLGGGHTAEPTPLVEQEESVPITLEQQPEWEHVKKLAQEERQRAALQMSLGQLQVFVQRESNMEIANEHGYP
ncbi:serine/arginine repetitive matrix protein 1-like [Grus japonensis]|uniref:Serine/arginine repetitive matrix protein 1-like n=1 Tax=Grus japonensis TaxID=30415 RepID=A0ABC9XQT0_GRUJA